MLRRILYALDNLLVGTLFILGTFLLYLERNMMSFFLYLERHMKRLLDGYISFLSKDKFSIVRNVLFLTLILLFPHLKETLCLVGVSVSMVSIIFSLIDRGRINLIEGMSCFLFTAILIPEFYLYDFIMIFDESPEGIAVISWSLRDVVDYKALDKACLYTEQLIHDIVSGVNSLSQAIQNTFKKGLNAVVNMINPSVITSISQVYDQCALDIQTKLLEDTDPGPVGSYSLIVPGDYSHTTCSKDLPVVSKVKDQNHPTCGICFDNSSSDMNPLMQRMFKSEEQLKESSDYIHADCLKECFKTTGKDPFTRNTIETVMDDELYQCIKFTKKKDYITETMSGMNFTHLMG